MMSAMVAGSRALYVEPVILILFQATYHQHWIWYPFLCHFECDIILLHGRHGLWFPHQVCSWGGYTFIINLIPMHLLPWIVTERYSTSLYIAYDPLISILSQLYLI